MHNILPLSQIDSRSRIKMKALIFLSPFFILLQTMAQNYEPLFLTPLINSGDIETAKQLAKVGPLNPAIDRESYSGFITVDQEKNSNLFFWFFPANESAAEAPLILWLDGGPGVTVFLTLFSQHGPFTVDGGGNFIKREEDWSQKHSVIYLDNPVGTGYSFTNQETGYSGSSQEAGENSYKFLQQFFKLFPEFLPNSFHIGGISYGGHFAPPLFQLIHEKNVDPSTTDKINLSGLLLYCPWVDPVNQVNYGTYLRTLGMIDEGAKLHFESEYEAIKVLIAEQKFSEAKQRSTQLLSKPDSYMFNKTGFSSALSVLHDKLDLSSYGFITAVQTPAFRSALHVGNLTFDIVSPPAQSALDSDFMTSVKSNVANILNYNYQGGYFNVTFITGQMDLSIIHLGVEEIISGLEWNGKQEFYEGERKIWKVGGDVAGYVRKGGNLQYVFMRNAGHMLIQDQPKWNLELVEKLTRNVPL